MDVDSGAGEQKISIQLNCSAARSMEHLTVVSQETDLVIIGFANGKLLQVCLDLAHLKGIAVDPESFTPYLDFQVFVESRLNIDNSNHRNSSSQQDDNQAISKHHHEDLNIEQIGPFWGAQVSYVGTIHPKMRRIRTDQNKEAVIACCDRPVVFYELDESIEMHYLAYRHIREIAYLTVAENRRPLLLYEDDRGVLHLSENDNLRRLQVQRMAFKM